MTEVNEMERYAALRKAGRSVIGKMVGQIPKKVFEQAARDLGFWGGKEKKTVVLRHETDMAVMCDYALHTFLENGRSLVQQYLDQAPADLDPDERLMLEAKAHSRFTLIEISNVVENWGVNVQDLLYHDSLFLTDRSFGQSGYPGMVLATRLITPASFVMAGGAPIPLLGPVLRQALSILSQYLRGRQIGELSAQEQVELEASIVVTAVMHGATNFIQYQ